MNPQNFEQLETIRTQCHQLLYKPCMASAAAAAIPIPAVDISSDLLIMVKLISTINHKFGLTAEQIATLHPERKKILLVIVTSVGSEFMGKMVTTSMLKSTLRKTAAKATRKSTLKYIPVVGAALSATISYTAMYYLGKHHIEQCYQVCKRYLNYVDTTCTADVIELN